MSSYGREEKFMERCDYQYRGDDKHRCAVFVCSRCYHRVVTAGDGCPTERWCPATWDEAMKRLREEGTE